MSRDEALARVNRQSLRDRLRDMIEFDGTVVCRSHEFGSSPVAANTLEYLIREERRI